MKIKINIPTTWNECSDVQLKKLALLMNSGATSKYFNHQCFCILVDAKWWHFKTTAKMLYILSWIPMRELLPSFKFIFEETNLTRFPKLSKKEQRLLMLIFQ